ncbi:hypothetical protein E9993_17655 [Labilibacter sediminis]|nr:hypothetical protein E9993_17655 [Labilibacter sediminis]
MRSQVIAFIIFLGTVNLMAQGEFSLYSLNESVPQAHQLNPAFNSNHTVVIGLPVIASTHLSLNTDQLSFNNMYSLQSNGNYKLDFDKISEGLNGKNNLSINSDVQLFFLALNLKKSHFTLAVNERISSLFTYSDDIVNLGLFGNGDKSVLGKKIDFSEMSLNQMVYHEIALGFAREINDKLTIGFRAKYLAGVGNLQIKDINGYAITTPEQIHIEHSGFSAYTAGNSYFDSDEDISTLLTNTLPGKNKNTGWAFDLGVNYSFNDKISISAAVNDIGYINWKDDTKESYFNPMSYNFNGFELEKFLDNRDSEDYFEQELDSLENLFTSEETDNIEYRSSLVANANVGFDYSFHPNHHIGAIAHASISSGSFVPAYGIYYNYQPKRVLNSVVNVAFRNGQLNLVGVGASLDLGPFQVYASTESLTSLIKPDNASVIDARLGINLIFGKNKKKKKKTVTAPDKVAAISYYEKPDMELEEELEIVDETIEPKIQEAPVASTVAVAEPVIVPQGNHKDELELGHYIVVGAFESKYNAEIYSSQLKNDGFDNNFGFLTNKDYYYVYVYENTGNIDKAREIRNNYRNINKHEFPNSWLLSVVRNN